MENSRLFSFEKLNFWQELIRFIKLIYQTTKTFPDQEKFGLISQLRRAAISVSSNIAEGTSRSSYKDQAHFSQIAYSSLMEVLSQIIVSLDLGFINIEKYKEIRSLIENLSRQINALRNSQLSRYNKQ